MSETLRPSNGAAPFEATDLLFSRTDDRGVIKAVNRVFQRVAAIPWEVLLGAPHKIIRHEDMPKAVFWLVWEALKSGQPTGVYLKNRTYDGLYYWVFATLSPIEGGYISTRVKPCDKILPKLEPIYANLRAQERMENYVPSDGAQDFLESLQELGYPDYSAFMSHAICTELREYSNATRKMPAAQMRPLRRALEHVSQLQIHAEKLFRNLSALRSTPVNMRLTAARIEGSSGPVGLMAHNYATVLQEVEDWLRQFLDKTSGDLEKITATTRKAAFDFANSQAQIMAIEQFASESVPEFADQVEAEMVILSKAAAQMELRANESLSQVQQLALSLDWAIRDMRRGCAGLNATRMMCKAESARLHGAGGLGAIVEKLDAVQIDTEEQASVILDASMRLLDEIETIQTIDTAPKATDHPVRPEPVAV